MSSTKKSLNPEIDPNTNGDAVSDRNDIARRAYEIHIERGSCHGYDLDDWFQAENELQREVTPDRPGDSLQS